MKGTCYAFAPAEQPNKSDAHPQMTEFVQCVNKGYKPQEMTWERAIARQLPSIKVRASQEKSSTAPCVCTAPAHMYQRIITSYVQAVTLRCASETGSGVFACVCVCARVCVCPSQVVGAWWTRRTSPVPLTVITHSDMGRLNQLEAQCHSWAGPLDATLYIPLVSYAQVPLPKH